MKIAKDINEGRLKLPDLEVNSNDEYEAIWALVDSGSSVHVIDVEAVLPGAKIRKPDADAPEFRTACGGTVKDLGAADVPFVSAEGNDHPIRWRNAKVAMPILSTQLLAKDNGELRYQVETGQIINVQTSKETHFIGSSGVYFQKMFIHKKYTQKDWASQQTHGQIPEGFARPGSNA